MNAVQTSNFNQHDGHNGLVTCDDHELRRNDYFQDLIMATHADLSSTLYEYSSPSNNSLFDDKGRSVTAKSSSCHENPLSECMTLSSGEDTMLDYSEDDNFGQIRCNRDSEKKAGIMKRCADNNGEHGCYESSLFSTLDDLLTPREYAAFQYLDIDGNISQSHFDGDDSMASFCSISVTRKRNPNLSSLPEVEFEPER